MARTQLRVYYGPQSDSADSRAPENTGVSIPFGEILPVLADAVRGERTWLQDFADEEITISTDLYEIILAYQHFRRPSA